MKKVILFFSIVFGCFLIFSQNQICVDGSSTGSENGTPANPYHTIQTAVAAASNGDIIKVAKGTYSESVQISQKKMQLLGGFAGSGDFNSANPETNETIIKGTNVSPSISVYMDAVISGSLIISGFTISNGQRGIELSGGWSGFLDNIVIENNIIENNGTQDTERGGGIGLEGKNVTIQNNIIRNNKAGRGAAIGVTDNLTNFLIAENRIENNTGYADHAGGVSICGTGTFTRNIFDGNEAAKECGYGWGGAILIFGDDQTSTVVNLSHNVYRNNKAPDRGGAIFVDDGATVTMEHELLYQNQSDKSGSAIYVDADYKYNPSTLNMNNCTVSGNLSDGAALFVQGSKAYIENSIFWNNGNDFEAIDDGTAIAELTVNHTLTQQGFTGTGNILSDPLFANTSTGDFHVKSKNGRFDPLTGQFIKDDVHSPAIDAGNPSSDYSNEPAPNGGCVNLGCYGNTSEASKSESTKIEENSKILWTITPNPAKEYILVNFLPIGSSIFITDLTGKKVYDSFCDNEKTTINIENFENGVYIIQVIHNGVVTHKKFVVNK